jgi:hypothetical protein
VISRFVTVGAVNTGAFEFPSIKATTPVLETKMLFELFASALAAVHGIVQKIVGVSISVSASHGPEDGVPRWSNRITIGYVTA